MHRLFSSSDDIVIRLDGSGSFPFELEIVIIT
jgi:hypothetical protein